MQRKLQKIRISTKIRNAIAVLKGNALIKNYLKEDKKSCLDEVMSLKETFCPILCITAKS